MINEVLNLRFVHVQSFHTHQKPFWRLPNMVYANDRERPIAGKMVGRLDFDWCLGLKANKCQPTELTWCTIDKNDPIRFFCP